MKWLKRVGIAVLILPAALAALWGFYEIFGMWANHRATAEQTRTLQARLEKEIPDLELLEVRWETGNTSGTGNHVDCLSSITFATGMEMAEVEGRMAEYYPLDGWGCYVRQEDGHYTISVITSAPLPDNIEGH